MVIAAIKAIIKLSHVILYEEEYSTFGLFLYQNLISKCMNYKTNHDILFYHGNT